MLWEGPAQPAYEFELDGLRAAVGCGLGRAPGDAFARIVGALRDRHPNQIADTLEWTLVYAAGFMQQLAVLHASPHEYLILTGAPTPSSGQNGPFRCDLYDIVIDGAISSFAAGAFEEEEHGPGDCFALPAGEVRGAAIRDHVWMLEYARGPIPTMFPLPVAGALFSTLDVPSLWRMASVATRVGARQWWARRRR